MRRFIHALVKIQNTFVIKFVVFGFRVHKHDESLIRLGSDYGGWWIQKDVLENKSISRSLISAGLGFDVTFDEELLHAGFEVIGLDPLEESVLYANHKLERFSKFTAINMGLWKDTGSKEFFPPKNKSHDSWSAINLQGAARMDFKEFDVISIKDLFDKFPQLESSLYCAIKMDVEGSEIELIHSIVHFNKKLDLLAIEMDFLSLIPFLSVWKRISMILVARKLLKDLDQRGYKLIMNENFNFIWV
jgi:hypothetical protein